MHAYLLAIVLCQAPDQHHHTPVPLFTILCVPAMTQAEKDALTKDDKDGFRIIDIRYNVAHAMAARRFSVPSSVAIPVVFDNKPERVKHKLTWFNGKDTLVIEFLGDKHHGYQRFGEYGERSIHITAPRHLLPERK